jgi:hypothetical protein
VQVAAALVERQQPEPREEELAHRLGARRERLVRVVARRRLLHRHGQRVARAVLLLEAQAAADGLEAAARHDGDAVAEDVGLLHRVRRQHDGAARLGLLDDVPHVAPADGVLGVRGDGG